MRRRLPQLLTALALVLAGGSGFMLAEAVGQTEPARTVTINLATGPQGPAGPAGPRGESGPPGAPGTFACPAGYTAGAVVINHPGGQTTIWTCLKN